MTGARGGYSQERPCGRPENGPLQIQWNGEVIPCCYDYNNQSGYPVDSEAYSR